MFKNNNGNGSAARTPVVTGLIMLVMIGFAVAARAQDPAGAPSDATDNRAAVNRALLGDWIGTNDGDFMELTIEDDGRFNLRSTDDEAKLMITGRLQDEGPTLDVRFDTWLSYDAGSPVPRVVKVTDAPEPASYTWRVVQVNPVEGLLERFGLDRLIVKDENGKAIVFHR